jgi:hypothetical protein
VYFDLDGEAERHNVKRSAQKAFNRYLRNPTLTLTASNTFIIIETAVNSTVDFLIGLIELIVGKLCCHSPENSTNGTCVETAYYVYPCALHELRQKRGVLTVPPPRAYPESPAPEEAHRPS